MTDFNFTQQLFADNFDTYLEAFDSQDAHPESFYLPFYDEFIAGSSFLTDAIKQEWLDEIKSICDELSDSDADFDSIIEDYDSFKEDIASDLIANNPQLCAIAIPQLFFHISECWNLDAIEDVLCCAA